MNMTDNSLIQANYSIAKPLSSQFTKGTVNASKNNNVRNNQNYSKGRGK